MPIGKKRIGTVRTVTKKSLIKRSKTNKARRKK
jgi:hypothetical protein